ncbi:tRNA (adenosine(37)-N6)-threonylcarbamoyltransferase complex dimerization subunit type 1 TsaB [Rhodospirillaceae bacterium KN72]|uniref:tRNA (Adenosine(37)-N6)-threonylcarbamoyltransferase complex dimerization subunit type 1 TsaB n=1 Tax=Pacificispira spongiicola TaxID=2729598 RepID=A0A7Y0E1Y3_9PROT|nr:tRNA (adenosine(37)-N6)-threonylcarbamoyltransferase complex dimerization subunit type 1 TsaB [Pacificispira spongiicola]NMM44956.1 tRNA (adenosine(37)-N6)-threonylcarbamoyltransferase complex dimerization subunit type 1 TsaB [Pacificispira spongiicola]
MIVLGLDCAGAACSAAIIDGDTIRARYQEEMQRGQAERIVPMIADCLHDAGLNVAALDGIAVTVGPGAFTGVRIGIAAAQGLSRAADIPLIGVTVTECLAAAIPADTDRPLAVVIDSRRADPFIEIFQARDMTWIGDGARAVAATVDALSAEIPENAVLIGDYADRLRDLIGRGTVLSALPYPDPAAVARLGRDRLRVGTGKPAVPLYLRAPDVSAPSRDKARRPMGPTPP